MLDRVNFFFNFEDAYFPEAAEERAKEITQGSHHKPNGHEGIKAGEYFSSGSLRGEPRRRALASGNQARKIKSINVRKFFDEMESKRPQKKNAAHDKQGMNSPLRKGMIVMAFGHT